MDRKSKSTPHPRQRSQKSPNLLPQDIIEEISSRLPVKSLLRFQCVSQSWRSFIGSDRFITNHFRNSTKNKNLAHHRVIYEDYYSVLKQCSLQALLNKASIYPSPIYGATGKKVTALTIVGHCNGLICILRGATFFLLNPATRIIFKLPQTNRFLTETRGFGWDEKIDAYVVFVVTYHSHDKFTGIIYSSKTNSWKTVEQKYDRLSLLNGTGEFLCGKLHWMCGRNIDSFDLKSEVFGTMEQPCPRFGYNEHKLGEIKGCLSLVYEYKKRHELDVWVLKKSWLKMVTIHLVLGRQKVLDMKVGLLADGEILVTFGSTMLVYNLCDYVFSSPGKVVGGGAFRDLFVCVESLVSPVPAAAHESN